MHAAFQHGQATSQDGRDAVDCRPAADLMLVSAPSVVPLIRSTLGSLKYGSYQTAGSRHMLDLLLKV